MKILINISVVSKNHRGMGAFTKDILMKLLVHSSIEFILVSCIDIDDDIKKIIDEKKLSFTQINSPLPLFEQFILPFLIKKHKPKSCWFPSNTFPIVKIKDVKYIATIHDIIYLSNDTIQKSIYQKIGKSYRKFTILKGISNVDTITSVSSTALNEINTYFHFPKQVDNSFVLYNSINNTLDVDDSILKKYELTSKKYIYTISGEATHKNLKFLLDSFNVLQKEYKNYTLVVSGVSKNQQHLFVNENVILTEFISNEEKNSLIKNAEFFAFASLKEGFGIPLIEAMSLNQNILASDIPVFKEIGDKYVNYFDPTNKQFLVEYIQNKKPITNDLKDVNLYIKNKFSIDTTVQKLQNILEA